MSDAASRKETWLLIATVVLAALLIARLACRGLRGNADNANDQNNRINPEADIGMAANSEPPSSQERRDYYNICRAIYRVFASFDFYVALFTGVLALVTYRLSEIADSTDTAMHAAAKAAENANKLNTAGLRPWIDIELTPKSDFMFSDDGVRFTINTKITNIGRSPAKSVFVKAKLIPWFERDEPVEERDALCANIRVPDSLPTSAPTQSERTPRTQNYPTQSSSYETPR
jgi:hypothetical protein